MRRVVLVFMVLIALPLAVPAQQNSPASSVPLNDTQVLGRRLFQQRCAVCHTESTPGARKSGIIGRPGRLDRGASRKTVRQDRDGQGVGF